MAKDCRKRLVELSGAEFQDRKRTFESRPEQILFSCVDLQTPGMVSGFWGFRFKV